MDFYGLGTVNTYAFLNENSSTKTCVKIVINVNNRYLLNWTLWKQYSYFWSQANFKLVLHVTMYLFWNHINTLISKMQCKVLLRNKNFWGYLIYQKNFMKTFMKYNLIFYIEKCCLFYLKYLSRVNDNDITTYTFTCFYVITS